MAHRWSDSDGLVRALRTISVVAFLVLVVVVVLDSSRADNWPLIALLVGAILLQLGYDVALRVPGFLEPHDEHDEHEEHKR